MSSWLHASADPSTSVDLIPYESALQRLLRAGVCSADSLHDYGLAQALRGVLSAVKSASRPVAIGTVPDDVSRVHHDGGSGPASEGGAGATVRVRGSSAVLYMASLCSLASRQNLNCVVYLSVHMLCESAATDLGEGNSRPCCTEEWTEALLSFDTVSGTASKSSPLDASLQRLCAHNRRYQFGYLLITAGTLRCVASGAAQGKQLYSDYTALCLGLPERVLPAVARIAEGQDDDLVITKGSLQRHRQSKSMGPTSSSNTDALVPHGITESHYRPPSRLSVEANNFVIHSFHWLCTDAMIVHGRPPSKRVLDRAVPQKLWKAVTHLRNALRRALYWVESDAYHCRSRPREHDSAVAAGSEGSKAVTSVDAVAVHRTRGLPSHVSAVVEEVFVDLLKQQEHVECARVAAAQKYGDSSKDCHEMDHLLWSYTVRMCLLVRDLTGACMATQGGLGLSESGSGVVQRSATGILMHVATCVTQIPALEGEGETPADVFCATAALLSACVAVSTAAPLPEIQERMWLSRPDVTRQVHGAIVQRALRYRDERVLRLASLLSGSILYSSSSTVSSSTHQGGQQQQPLAAISSFAADSSEQLLEFIADSRDAASHCVVEMLSAAIAARPHVLIPALFRILEHGTAMARRNALDVLAGLPQLQLQTTTGTIADSVVSPADGMHVKGTPVTWVATAPTPSSLADGGMREVLRLLGTHLLTHLEDEELCVRMQTASLFAKIWPEDVIRPLLNLSLQRDPTGRRQDSVRSALTTVVTSHAQSADVVLLLLEEAFDVLTELTGSTGAPASGSASGALLTEQGERRRPEAFVSSDRSTSSSKTLRSAIPTTPGDVLRNAMLYSTETLNDSTAVRDSAESTEVPAARPDLLVSKTERLRSLVLFLCKQWVAGVQDWRSDSHLVPLMNFLRRIPDSHEGAQQWYMRCVTHIISSATSNPESATSGKGVQSSTQRYEAVFGAINGIMRSAHPKLRSWGELPAQWSEYSENDPPERLATAYSFLLPLLCLRSCSGESFLYSARGIGGAQSPDATLLENAGEVAVPAPPAALSSALQSIWDALWGALVGHQDSPFLAKHKDIQRVLLEVVGKFPADIVLKSIDSERARSRCAGTGSDLFLCRVTMFTVCSRLASSPDALQPQLDRGNKALDEGSAVTLHTQSKDLESVLVAATSVFQIVETVVMPWLLEDKGSPQLSHNDENNVQKLAMASADAVALLMLVSIAQNSMSRWKQCRPIVLDPFWDLAAFYRENSTSAAAGKASTALPHTASTSRSAEERIVRMQYGLQVHRRVVEVLGSHPLGGPLLPLWLGHLLEPLIEVSNAACASPAGRADPQNQVATQCCDFLFHVVVLSSKIAIPIVGSQSTVVPVTTLGGVDIKKSLPSAIAATSHRNAHDEGTPSLLSRLPFAEREALARFAIGSARYSGAVQKSGVRLLSALLGAAPELLVDVDRDDNLQLLNEATETLRSVSLMHADGQTRVLAEQVLTTLFNASQVA